MGKKADNAEQKTPVAAGDEWVNAAYNNAVWENIRAGDDQRDFMMVLRQALLMIVRYIEKKYKLGTT